MCDNFALLNSCIYLVPNTFPFSTNSLMSLAKKAGFKVEKCNYFRAATKFEGIANKFLNSKIKKLQYYPRIITTNKKGRFLRLILKSKYS